VRQCLQRRGGSELNLLIFTKEARLPLSWAVAMGLLYTASSRRRLARGLGCELFAGCPTDKGKWSTGNAENRLYADITYLPPVDLRAVCFVRAILRGISAGGWEEGVDKMGG
jgi:hypothetical protein